MILSVLYESLTISIGNQGKNEQNHFNYYSISRILHIRILATLPVAKCIPNRKETHTYIA